MYQLTPTQQEPIKKARDFFNSLPYEVRSQLTALETATRIQHLEMEKKRLKENYNKHLAEINSHLKNLIKTLNNKSKNI
jgi:hypothetical protein